jgi:hypothetical protein
MSIYNFGGLALAMRTSQTPLVLEPVFVTEMAMDDIGHNSTLRS